MKRASESPESNVYLDVWLCVFRLLYFFFFRYSLSIHTLSLPHTLFRFVISSFISWSLKFWTLFAFVHDFFCVCVQKTVLIHTMANCLLLNSCVWSLLVFVCVCVWALGMDVCLFLLNFRYRSTSSSYMNFYAFKWWWNWNRRQHKAVMCWIILDRTHSFTHIKTALFAALYFSVPENAIGSSYDCRNTAQTWSSPTM